jgi:hypothetical protein
MPAFSRSTRFLVYFLDSLQEASRDLNSQSVVGPLHLGHVL